jgi:hypothetical protein
MSSQEQELSLCNLYVVSKGTHYCTIFRYLILRDRYAPL